MEGASIQIGANTQRWREMETTMADPDYAGFGSEYSLPPRAPSRSGEAPENPPAELSLAVADASAFAENPAQETMLLSYASTPDPLWQ
jgi:hypothetical protein